MDGLPARAALALAGAATVSLTAWRARALSAGGALAATAIGAAVVSGAGRRGGTMLIAFFVSSTLLGRLPGATRLEQRRGGERDAVQVAANGGVAALLALASQLAPKQATPWLVAGFGGAVATAAADTWATEIGSRSRTPPRSILTWQPSVPGASGAVTGAGLLASTAGAALIAGLAAAPVAAVSRHRAGRAVPIVLGGFTGALVDSVLGATVQEVRFCDACAIETETWVHSCGTATRPIRGIAWCDNDSVNAMATAAGAATAMLVHLATRDPQEFS